ncbi:MAG TPA: FHA domain-containing protein [Ktedonobacterales bacterium]|nr:FHA domain-containing protein [Ktedonobacterales bacterium]
MAYLEFETPEGGKRVALERERLSIGRLSYNDVVLSSPQISRQHAELRRINGEWWIADLHSTNGVRLDGQRVQEHQLTPGQRLVLAPGISFRFVEDGPPFASTPSGQRPAANARQLTPRPPSSPPPAAAPSPPGTIFTDDEVPYAQQGAAERLPWGSPAGTAMDAWNGMQTMRPAGRGSAPINGRGAGGSGGYPAPPGPMVSGSDVLDPNYLNGLYGGRAGAGSSSPASPAPSPAAVALHVCQTCGQRTAPDAVYCQNCHHSIAVECPNCRLSLLPIQDRCPRCHTPNASAVRRAH